MKQKIWFVVGRILLLPLMKLLFFYRTRGNKIELPERGCIVCCNHLSNFDPVLLALTQRRPINYMAKAELFKNPLLGWLIRQLGAFPVQRGAGDGKAIQEAEKVIEEGRLLGIFIEGTRSKTGEFLRPKSGAAIIAQQMKVPVIPVCITPKKKKIRLFQQVTISWGTPMTPEELGLDREGSPECYRSASRKIMDEIKKLRERDCPWALPETSTAAAEGESA